MRRFTLLALLLAPLAALALEINDASRAQLEQLNGVGVTMAEQMLAERAKAPFAGWDDLRRRVKGIGSRRAAQWQAQGVTVNGEGDRRAATAPRDGAKGDKEQGR
jgi:competence protein ComEA